jgi:hypothetical protein
MTIRVFEIDFDGYDIVRTDEAPRPKYIFNKMWN